jgi:hypothetical protein
MVTPVNSRMTVRKNRLMRRWFRILREIGKAVLLGFMAVLLGVAMVFGYSYVITASCFALDKRLSAAFTAFGTGHREARGPRKGEERPDDESFRNGGEDPQPPLGEGSLRGPGTAGPDRDRVSGKGGARASS